jgi:hypothetical protein
LHGIEEEGRGIRHALHVGSHHRHAGLFEVRDQRLGAKYQRVDTFEPEVRGAGTILGRREPAYSLIPKHRSSRGPEAVELMRRAGLELDSWQGDVLEGAMGVSKGRWTAPETALFGSQTEWEDRVRGGRSPVDRRLRSQEARDYQLA